MAIVSIAGHPEYVGVINISTLFSGLMMLMFLTMPRSLMVSTGTSGSGIVLSIDNILFVSTTLNWDKYAAYIAFLGASYINVRYAFLPFLQ